MADNIKSQLWLLAAGFAALLTIPFLVPHTGPLALVALIPLFELDRLLDKNSVKYAFWYYFSAFLLFNIGSTFWIWWVSEVGAVSAIILNSLQMAAIFALYRWSKRYFGVWSLAFFAITWLAWEHVYFDVEASWPWLVLGNAFATSTQAVQWYDTLGSLGGSLWILLSNILIFCCIHSKAGTRRKALAACAAAVVIIPLTISYVKYATYEETDDPVEVVVIQPNVDPFAKYGVTPQAGLDSTLIALAEKVITPSTDFVITPETFTYDVNVDNIASNVSVRRYADFLRRHPGTDLIFGALTYRIYDTAMQPTPSAYEISNHLWCNSFNTALLVDSSFNSSYYFKSRLVPGVEIIPYQNTLKFFGKLIAACGGSSHSYGTQEKMTALSLPGKRTSGVMICYESIYGDFSRTAVSDGAEFMSVITNDGWWGDTPGYRQHFRYAALRAIEYRRDIVHAANTGISGIFNQRGDVVCKTPWWVETSFNATINCNKKITPFVKRGDVVGRTAGRTFLVLLVTLLIFSVSGIRFGSGKSA